MESISRAEEIVRRHACVTDVVGHVEEHPEDLHENVSENRIQDMKERYR